MPIPPPPAPPEATSPPGRAAAFSLWRRLTAPSARVTEPGDRRSARLLAGLLLALFTVGLVSGTAQLLLVDGFLPTFRLILGAMSLLVVGYVFARTAWFRVAAALAAAVPIITGALVGLARPDDVAWFAFLSLGMPLAAAFLPLRLSIGAAVVSIIVGIGVVQAAGGAVSPAEASAIIAFIAATAAITTLGRAHLALVERDRERALRDAAAQYQSVFAHAPVGIGVSGPDGRLVQANEALLTLLGLDGQPTDALPKVPSLYADPGVRDALIARLRAGDRVVAEEVRLRRKDGSILTAETSLVPLELRGEPAIIAIVEDVGPQRQLQSDLLQAKKMESLGRLAGGVAHDFNNLLTVIGANLELALLDLSPGHLAAGGISEAMQAAESASGVTRQLLAFSRRQVIEPRALDVNELVRQLDRLLRRLVGEHITLRTSLAEPPGTVRADAAQLEQALVNLAVNARDAMPDGGQLTITTDASRRPDPRAPERLQDCVSIAVSDTGHGMDAEVLSHLFEPFFSTKAHGAGTGLGLASVHGAIAQQGGTVEVQSSPGQGSTFTIHLPRMNGSPAEMAAPADRPVAGGHETILIVEDDAAVRLVAQRSLGRLGYTVLTADDGAAALRVVEEHRGPLDLVVTDVIMPGLNGRLVGEAIRRQRPETKVLHVSGYTADLIGRHGVLEPGVAFLSKPYSAETLGRRVRELLDG